MKTEDIKKVLSEIYTSLKKGKYDAEGQIVGYLSSGDPGYVPTFEQARSKIISLDREEVITILLKEFLK